MSSSSFIFQLLHECYTRVQRGLLELVGKGLCLLGSILVRCTILTEDSTFCLEAIKPYYIVFISTNKQTYKGNTPLNH